MKRNSLSLWKISWNWTTYWILSTKSTFELTIETFWSWLTLWRWSHHSGVIMCLKFFARNFSWAPSCTTLNMFREVSTLCATLKHHGCEYIVGDELCWRTFTMTGVPDDPFPEDDGWPNWKSLIETEKIHRSITRRFGHGRGYTGPPPRERTDSVIIVAIDANEIERHPCRQWWPPRCFARYST